MKINLMMKQKDILYVVVIGLVLMISSCFNYKVPSMANMPNPPFGNDTDNNSSTSKPAQSQNSDNSASSSSTVVAVVYFDYNNSLLDNSSISRLNDIAKELSPSYKYYIKGYADDSGNEAYNLLLSKKRAENVRSHLTSNGITVQKLVVQGYGENTDYPDPAQNRRVEIVVGN